MATLTGSLFCFSETLLNLWKQNTKQMKKALLLLIEKIEYEQKINRELIVLFDGINCDQTVSSLLMLCRHNSQRLTELKAISKLSK